MFLFFLSSMRRQPSVCGGAIKSPWHSRRLQRLRGTPLHRRPKLFELIRFMPEETAD
jgi:hypothetical protein